ncbi:actin cortical patch SUR7/pH-response regulator pali [Naematelia encephala]|uniref:Actin cortical patch SUR7/pH-response regulator pali n=1 Tax=Naematelia encephala TaxID=71784 RepID=A0A1Y2B6S4_9TREE|nr:actin cortical patch SUR7/pH-response regulator pali [Naematelia encephala]
MRGEHCIAGASILSAISVILLVFAHIGQVSSGTLTNSIYMVEVNVEAYGNALKNVSKTTPGGLYDTKNDYLGKEYGIRQFYRYGLYNACGYQKAGSGICNSTIFGYPFEPLAQISADTPTKYQTQWTDIIPTSSFKDNSWNSGLSRAGSLLIFIGSLFAALAFIVGWIRARICFLIAAGSAGLSALLLMVGSAIWTAIIAKDASISSVKVQYGAKLGILVTAGPTLYLTWVSFALVTLSVLPYVVACCTFRRK